MDKKTQKKYDDWNRYRINMAIHVHETLKRHSLCPSDVFIDVMPSIKTHGIEFFVALPGTQFVKICITISWIEACAEFSVKTVKNMKSKNYEACFSLYRNPDAKTLEPIRSSRRGPPYLRVFRTKRTMLKEIIYLAALAREDKLVLD